VATWKDGTSTGRSGAELERYWYPVFNVENYMVGGSVTAASFTAAIAAASAVRGTVYIPPGIYEIDDTITGANNVRIVGGGSVFPRYGAYTTTERLPVTIKTSSSFPSTTDYPMLDFSTKKNYRLDGIELVGNYKCAGLKQGTYGASDSGSFYGNTFIEHCSFTHCNIGVAAKEATYQKFFRCAFNRNVKYGLGLTNTCGDCEINDCYINGNGRYDSSGIQVEDNTSTTEGYGLYLGVNTGNSVVTGGKIESNKLGAFVQSPGIIFDGVQFDANEGTHVRIRNDGIASTPLFTGCRFLGGGWRTNFTYPGSHIWVTSDAGSTTLNTMRYPVHGQFTGCTFKSAPSSTPFEYSGSTAYTTAASGIVRLSFSGCDMHRATNSGLYFNSTTAAHQRSEINLSGNHMAPSNLGGSNLFAGESNLIPVYVNMGGQKHRFRQSTGAPSTGLWHLGDRHVGVSYDNNGGPAEQICVTAGSFFTFGAAPTASGTASDTEITLSENQELSEGDVIAIAGSGAVYHFVRFVNYTNEKIVISPALTNTVAAAAVSFPAPTFRPLSGTIGYGRVAPSSYPYTVLATDSVVSVSTASARTINLLSAASYTAGRILVIKDRTGSGAANNITINRDGTDTIDGANSVAISSNYGVVRLVSNGSNGWEVI
jgi:hypothetical protein